MTAFDGLSIEATFFTTEDTEDTEVLGFSRELEKTPCPLW